MLHLGDIAKINGAEVPAVNAIIGGSPCQDLSVAGKRAGISGERSGLFMEQLRIIKEMRRKDIENGAVIPRPRYMVWENVPGAFSSNKGEDFRIVLEETAKVVEPTATIPRPEKGKWANSGAVMGDGWSIAWRVFDAQFWGVPQRRRRIALVADFGGTTAPEILFERESVSGDIAKSGKAWKDFAANLENHFGKSNKNNDVKCDADQKTYCIQGNAIDRADTAGCNGCGWTEGVSYTLNTVDRPAVFDARGNGDGETVPTITGDHENRVTDYTSVVCGFPLGFRPENVRCYEGKATTICNGTRAGHCNGIVCMATQQGGAEIRSDDKSPTLTAAAGMSGNNQPVIAIDRAAFNQGENALYEPKISEDGINSTLTAKGPSAVCASFKSKAGAKAHGIGYEEEKAPTLSAGQHDISVVTQQSTVRRLTPLECERLQGFPDNWTNIGDYTDTKGKKRKTSDTARYKALGNSIALPPWVWVLSRLSEFCTDDLSMASLFDGIGGFPLIWETLNGEKTCAWASEIEEFPIAVTKRHFS